MPDQQSSFKVQQTDMTRAEAEFAMEAGSLLLGKLVQEQKPGKNQKTQTEELETEFVQSLKVVLDQRFGPEWTVVGGLDFGFSLKSRKKSAIVMNGNLFGKNFQVVCYRSPAHEIFGNAVVAALADRRVRGLPKLAPEQISDHLNQQQQQQQQQPAGDHQTAAQRLREAASAATDLPVWHCVVGTDFRVAFPRTREHETSLVLSRSGSGSGSGSGSVRRAVLFRHAQEAERKWLAYLPALSKVVMVLFCVGLMLQSRLGVSDKMVQGLGLAVLGLAVLKLAHTYADRRAASKQASKQAKAA